MVYCPNCGADSTGGAYCSECGASVSTSESRNTEPGSQPSRLVEQTEVRPRQAPSLSAERMPFSTGLNLLSAIGIGFILLVIGAASVGFAHGFFTGADDKEEQAAFQTQATTSVTPTPIAQVVTQPILPVDENPVTAVVVRPALIPVPPPTVPPPPPPAPTTLTFEEWINAVLVIDQTQNAERGRWLSAYERGDYQAAQTENAIRIGTPSKLQLLVPPACAQAAQAQFLAAAEDWAESARFLSTWVPAATYSPETQQELQRATDLMASGDSKYDVFRTMLQTTCA